MSGPDTYAPPPHGWTCFHCGETFTTPGSARDHFGTPIAEPGCVLSVQVGGQRGLLAALRKTEDVLSAWMNEGTALHKEFAAQQSRHSEALRTAEESGYERGIRDTSPSVQWLVRALVTLAKRELADANASCGDDWPAGQEWRQLGHTSQHSFMRRAREAAGIPHVEYRALIEAMMRTDMADAFDALWKELEQP